MNFEQQTLQAMRELQSAYWEKRDRDQVVDLLDDAIVWIETGKTEIVVGLSNVQRMLEKEMAVFPMPFAILSSQYHSQFIKNEICSLYGTLEVCRTDGDVDFPAVYLPISANLHQLNGQWKVCQIHMSSSLLFQQGRVLSADLLQANNQLLYSQLAERNRDLKELMNNIPGGVFHCEFDEKVTLLQMSDAFLSMFGYTREEIRGKFDDSFLAMIYPEDRPTCLDASPSQMLHALLIIDIDNFKEINDTWGHLFGDKVLVRISSQMKKLFRSSDILGRIGGDEFIVLLKNVPSREFAVGKAKQLRELFLTVSKEEENSYHISGSIGVAFYPQDGETFEQLYHKADVALYYAKAKGKNCCEAYTGDMECESFFQSKVLTPIDETNCSQKGEKNKNRQLIESIFYVMCKSLDIYSAISSILEMVGKQFDVSRAYVFEETQDPMKMHNTFEWCNDGIEPQMQDLQHLSLQEWGDYYDNFDQNGIFNCRDIQVLPEKERELLAGQGIKSLVQYAILDRGKIRGFVGFDECRMQRFWTQEQVDTLHLIAEILSTFLLKQREWEQMETRVNRLQSLLDHQNAWVYAIERKSFRLLFVNKKTKDSFPNVKNGMRCYEALWGKEHPCDHCPVQNSSSLVELCHNIPNHCLRLEVSPLPWKGKKVSLVTCYDLTELLEEEKRSSL